MICCVLISTIVAIILILSSVIAFILGIFNQYNVKTGAGDPTDIVSREEALQLEYPYKKYFTTEEMVARAFADIKKYELIIVPAEYKIINIPTLTESQKMFNRAKEQLLIAMSESDYRTMNWVSDWFNEKCRLACRRYDEKQSPLDYWNSNRMEIIDKVARSGTLTYEKLHDAVYEKVRGCNNFRPGLMTGFIKYFGAKSVLDFSAGWGDRLIGAIAAGARYVGVDPNPCVHAGYKEIIDTFVGNDSKYTLIQSPFETAELPDETYDLVLTSPPYFDLEIYSDDSSQSILTHSNLDDWFEKFLMFSLEKSWEKLNPGGHMVIVINNIRGKPDFVMKMVERTSAFPGAEYLGLLPYADSTSRGYKSPQPIWIWKKNEFSG